MKSDRDLLKEIAMKLETMARESKNKGCCTEHIKPQQELADKIYIHVHRKQTRELREEW